MKILVGLGNYGDEYEGTRHNVGRDFLFWFATKNNFSEFKNDSFLKALVSEGEYDNQKYILVLPQTYMNLSGETVVNIFKKWSEVNHEDVVIIHDDIDINFGEIKMSTDKGHGGHNGIKSILNLTGQNLKRIRIGICPKAFFGGFKKPNKEQVANFVLKKFGLMERGEVENIYKKVAGKV